MNTPNTLADNRHNAPLFLGIDLGTSGVRAIVIDSSGNIVSQVRTEYPHSSAFHSDSHPENWWHAVVHVIEGLLYGSPQLARAIVSISVDGTSSSVLICDENGLPLHEALMYFDRRAVQQAKRIQAVCPQHNPAAAITSGLAKWLWLQENCHWQGRYHLLHQADWIAGKLAGRFDFSDENNALKSGYDPLQKCWPDWVKTLVSDMDALPNVLPAGIAVCTLSETIANQFGFDESTIIVSGTTDSTAAVIATGASDVGDAITSLGSTLVLKVISDRPVSEAEAGIYSQPFGNVWLVGGASNSGGSVLRQFFTDTQMAEYQQKINVNQETQLDYYPLPEEGERFPLNNPQMKSRITPRPKNDVIFFQGLLEGIANIEYLGYTKLHACGAPWPNSIRTTGGGSKNTAWKLIRQNKLKLPMSEVQQIEAAYGSARLARRGWADQQT